MACNVACNVPRTRLRAMCLLDEERVRVSGARHTLCTAMCHSQDCEQCVSEAYAFASMISATSQHEHGNACLETTS